jgi:hypothetical protein
MRCAQVHVFLTASPVHTLTFSVLMCYKPTHYYRSLAALWTAMRNHLVTCLQAPPLLVLPNCATVSDRARALELALKRDWR